MLKHMHCFIILEPIPSQSLNFVESSDERALNTSESVKDTLHTHEGGVLVT